MKRQRILMGPCPCIACGQSVVYSKVGLVRAIRDRDAFRDSSLTRIPTSGKIRVQVAAR